MQPAEHPEQEEHPELAAIRAVLEKQSLPLPSCIPSGLVLDWIDASRDVAVQVMRKQDRLIYDPVSKSFKSEDQCQSNGLIALHRDSGLRTSYQYVELPTPQATFPDGAYGVYYYDAGDKSLLEAAGFHVYQGIPFEGYGFPYFKLIPTADENAVAMVVKLFDNTTVSLHKKPDTPGLAFFNLLNQGGVAALAVTGQTGTRVGLVIAEAVQANNANGLIVPGYRGTVKFTSTDPLATLPANYTFTAADAGRHVFNTIKFGTAGSQTLTATDTATGSITGKITITVNP